MEYNKKNYNNKKIIIKIIDIAIVILWMCIVFWFSSQVGDASKAQSGNTIRKIITFLNNNISSEKLEMIVEALQPVVRKIAHFSIYTLGGILIYNMINKYKLTRKRKVIYTTIIGALYATSDEIHQLFVPYRSGQISDVLIDTCGIICGIIISIIISTIIKFIKNKYIKKLS